ncbi:unnamed protein product [Ilex paraguariensis]|uniref:Uncharacterized protein n=1 Tax=Ilex paraguariensis TaxID=185542 RepID=A0ABC8RSM0_9AQUA
MNIERILDSCMAQVFQRLSLKRQIQEEQMEGRPTKVTRREDGILEVSSSNIPRGSVDLGGTNQALEYRGDVAFDANAEGPVANKGSLVTVFVAPTKGRRVRKFVRQHALMKHKTKGDNQVHVASIDWLEAQPEMVEVAGLTMPPPPSMKIIAWNCQGLGSSLTVLALQDLCANKNPKFFALAK